VFQRLHSDPLSDTVAELILRYKTSSATLSARHFDFRLENHNESGIRFIGSAKIRVCGDSIIESIPMRR